MIESLHFLRPWWLLLMPLVPVIWWLHGRTGPGVSSWLKACDPALVRIQSLTHDVSGGGPAGRSLITLILLLAILALSGPSWKQGELPLLRDRDALVIALDLSTSMLSHDVAPSRYIRARFKIADLLGQRRSGDTALLVYAAEAFTVTPLTHDTATIIAMLPALSPRIMPQQGSNTLSVVQRASELLERSKLQEADLVLVTDGIRTGELKPLIDLAGKHRIRISVLAVGTTSGTKVPALNDIGFTMDNGEPVVSKLDEASLMQLADETGGLYLHAQAVQRDTLALTEFLQQHRGSHENEQDAANIDWQDMGVWLLLPCLPLAALLFRRHLFIVLLLAMIVPMSPETRAEEAASNWFTTQDQRGFAAFEQHRYEQAVTLFSDPRWQAAALFRQDRFEEAYELYKNLDDTESIYNRANTLVYLTRFDEALVDYNRVLKRQPEHVDARHNLDQLIALLRELSGDQDSQPGQGGETGEDSDDSENEEQEENDEEASESEREAQQAGDQQENNSNSGINDPTPINATRLRPSDSPDASPTELGNVSALNDEDRLAEDQWLRRIQDDPAGLLRRKFQRQSQERKSSNRYGGEPW